MARQKVGTCGFIPTTPCGPNPASLQRAISSRLLIDRRACSSEWSAERAWPILACEFFLQGEWITKNFFSLPSHPLVCCRLLQAILQSAVDGGLPPLDSVEVKLWVVCEAPITAAEPWAPSFEACACDASLLMLLPIVVPGRKGTRDLVTTPPLVAHCNFVKKITEESLVQKHDDKKY